MLAVSLRSLGKHVPIISQLIEALNQTIQSPARRSDRSDTPGTFMPTPPLQPAQSSASADLSGRQLGDLKLLRRLGRGAMAEVYLAEQLRLNRRVAVKILKPELADDRTYLQRFQREAQAAASLVHANIVQIHEVGHAEGLHYIVQEYIAGLDLRQWMVRNGPAASGPGRVDHAASGRRLDQSGR